MDYIGGYTRKGKFSPYCNGCKHNDKKVLTFVLSKGAGKSTDGDDTVIVTADTDSVQAGTDTDTGTVIFADNYSDYTFSQSDSYVSLMTHNTTGQAKSLYGVEKLQFADATADLINTGATFTTAPNYAVTLNDTSSAANANTVMSDTTGVVTATVTATGEVSELNTALSNASGTDALTLVLDASSASAADLNTLGSKTSVVIDAATITTITSSTADAVNTMVTNASNIGLDSNWDVTLSDTSLSAAEVKTINASVMQPFAHSKINKRLGSKYMHAQMKACLFLSSC